MTEPYLDITKSVMISSPAGSGKTEKLARRYIALLRNGSDVERILAITFTDKASAEMKERIVNILKVEDSEIFHRVRKNLSRMRISTIHSFCLKLLKRFCLELGIDPSLEVMDSFNADILWSEAVYESLLEDGLSGERLFYDVIRDTGLKGWNKLYSILRDLHAKRPTIELGIKGMVRTELDSDRALQGIRRGHLERIITVYGKCLDRYRRKKRERHTLDYNDLELMAYEAISGNPEWQNVLFSFDEHTDHILVDEFQDTSSLQWQIIDKLTEEWRSGIGAKRESGVKPSIFVVGDDKQSIYSFRGANVSIFKNAKKRLSDWLGDEYQFIEVKENYRSLPAIVNFVNALFERLMPKGLYDDWRIEYTPFEAARQSVSDRDGHVELILIDGEGTTRDNRKLEAAVLAERIQQVQGSHEVHDQEETRPCNYGDIAILLRSRTHLSVFEDALRGADIPFVVVKGIGFYNTPEVAILKSLLFFLIDPKDDYSLFNVLRSPLFAMDYGSLLGMMRDGTGEGSSYGHLYDELHSRGKVRGPAQGSLWEKEPDTLDRDRLQSVLASLRRWLEMAKDTPFATMLEEVLNDTGAWRHFHERQRYLNAKKFIKLVEEFESKGLAGLEIRENLIKASTRADEPKANVNTEGMNAVKLMTIHASKGLQFPIVFLPCLDEDNKAQGSSPVALDEESGGIRIGYAEDAALRKTIPIFQRQKEKAQEEEKRLFYVGITRAMDHICMSGVFKNDKPSGKLSYLSDAFNIHAVKQEMKTEFLTVRRITPEALKKIPPVHPRAHLTPLSAASSLRAEMIFTEPIDKTYKAAFTWLDVTEEIDSVRKRHGDHWVILGRAFHRLFEGLSNGTITLNRAGRKIINILKNETMSDKAVGILKETIVSDLRHLEESGYLSEIILPQENSFSELPFILQRGTKIYRGRIDRVIIAKHIARIYDYKTYPVTEMEIPELAERYSFQMNLYREAVENLFSVRAEAFLFFTHESRLIQT